MIKRTKYLFTLLILCYEMLSFAQPGGKAFQFLEMTNSARVASLGGKAIAIYDDDLNLPYYNPSLLSPGMDNNLVLNYVSYFAGINYGYAAYSRSYEGIGNFAAGIHYLNYGSFIGADATGAKTTNFRASEYALNLIYSRKIDSLIFAGVNLKPIYSSLETYSSFALAMDIGVTYHNPDKLFTASLVLRNFGTQLYSYYPNGDYEHLPFDIALGFSKGLAHSPFKFYIIADHLEKFDLTYQKEEDKNNSTDAFASDTKTESKFDNALDKTMRHITIGTEFTLTQSFVLRFGYNYRRRQEMKVDSRPGTVGFSWGVGIRIKKFHFSYARSAFHLAGSPNYFSLSMNLSEFNKKL